MKNINKRKDPRYFGSLRVENIELTKEIFDQIVKFDIYAFWYYSKYSSDVYQKGNTTFIKEYKPDYMDMSVWCIKPVGDMFCYGKDYTLVSVSTRKNEDGNYQCSILAHTPDDASLSSWFYSNDKNAINIMFDNLINWLCSNDQLMNTQIFEKQLKNIGMTRFDYN